MLITILAILAALVLGVLVLAATKPKTFRYERRARIAAAPEKVVALLNDFHHWSAWSPWEKLDPAMQRTHRGAAAGVGAIYEWSGNKKAGSGRMEVLAATPTLVKIQLDFITPFKAHNLTEFAVVANGAASDVVWAMYGESPFVSRLMSVFINLDKMIGKDFEAGLVNLNRLASAH
ncbi:MAG: SRPBCC family protein [Kofleriaceae bacterium]|nr:SRPBCC family protein [Kofleriaceae bacterium]